MICGYLLLVCFRLSLISDFPHRALHRGRRPEAKPRQSRLPPVDVFVVCEPSNARPAVRRRQRKQYGDSRRGRKRTGRTSALGVVSLSLSLRACAASASASGSKVGGRGREARA